MENNNYVTVLDFHKYKYADKIKFAYNILTRLHRKKAEYVIKAINFYVTLNPVDVMYYEIESEIAAARQLQAMYNLQSDGDIESLLSTQIDDINTRTPRKMCLGFNQENPEAVKVKKLLDGLSMNARLNLVSSAVTLYYATKSTELNALQVLNSLKRDFQTANKEAAVRTLSNLIAAA